VVPTLSSLSVAAVSTTASTTFGILVLRPL